MPKQQKKSKLWILWVALGVGALFFMGFFFLIIAVMIGGSDFSFGNVAVIKIRGVITTDGSVGTFGDVGAASADIVGFIEDADNDPLIEAIVIDINSPGGSAVGSDEIAQALKRAEKPTVSLIHEGGTSGAYWVASATDYIIANRMSIVGSIGVIASYLEFSELFEEYGITYQRFVAGKHKDLGSPFKSVTAEERKLFQGKLDTLHDFFIGEIAKNRRLDEREVRGLATGEIFLGSEAVELGLVDQIGDQAVLEEYLISLGIKDHTYRYYEREATLFDILGRLTSEQFFFLGKGLGKSLTEVGYQQQIVLT
jgi:protease IV